MTRIRTHNRRRDAKALSRRQIRERKHQRLMRKLRGLFQFQALGLLKIGSNFRDASFAMRNLGKSLNSFHLMQHYGSPTGRLVDNFEPRMRREGHTPPPIAFLDVDYTHIEERILSTLEKKQLYAEAYGAGDLKVAMLTGQYPNAPIRKKP